MLPDKSDNYCIKLKINGKYQNFTIDTVHNHAKQPETIHPKRHTTLKERYQDVHKTEIKLLGKVWGNIEYNGETTNLPILITQRDNLTPLLGLIWLETITNSNQQNVIG